MKREQQQTGRRAGFTLAELMVVIVILGLLATVVAPNVIGYLTQGKWTKVKADIKALDDAVNAYAARNMGKFPETLQALVDPDDYGNSYLKRKTIPKDPWQNEYRYDPPMSGSEYRIYTYGADGIPGGEKDDQDYDNIMLQEE